MPRDGSGIYTYPPGTPGIPDTTIESAKYNGYIADVQQDLNLPRPIVAGGTGATNATQARDNLDAERAMQVVTTSYDSHVFESGSFYNNPVSGLAAPVDGHAFVGSAYVVDTGNIVLEARDESDITAPGRVWVREKKGGIWGAWTATGTTTIGGVSGISGETSDMFFGLTGAAPNSWFIVNNESDIGGVNVLAVAKSGLVTLSGGDLLIDKVSPALNLKMGSVAGGAVVESSIGVTRRWRILLGDGATESGGNTGSNFAIARANDAGTIIDTPFWIARQTGSATFGGIVYFNNVPNRFETGNILVSVTGYKPGGGTWADSSDIRIKNVLGAYQHGLDEIMQINPVRYTFKGNVTTLDPEKVPQELKNNPIADHSAVLDKEFVGVVAQEIEGPMPETVTQITGYIEGQKVEDLRILDSNALTYALINAVKTLAARIEALEAAQAPP